ncbi:MAG: hypothetical protein ACYDGR_06410 [Candidatus Dormibacteria bacterium]
MSRELVVDGRFCGPPGVANGGYLAGLLGEILGVPAQVTLRRPAPLGRPLDVVEGPGRKLVVSDQDEMVAEAEPREISVDIHPSVTFVEAQQAASGFEAFRQFQFGGCFVCGNERPPGDGLQISPGRVARRTTVASPWVPADSLSVGEGDLVRVRYMWAALDCVGAYALHAAGATDEPLLLGRITAKIVSPVSVKEKCVVMGWPVGGEGVKLFAATAILNELGWVAAVSAQTWFRATRAGSSPHS